ncbi:MAG: penicillin-binding protein 1C [Pseudomonadota bacterium]|nr:penicillin-binding protein 1C [Pseudomonadota bacterium]
MRSRGARFGQAAALALVLLVGLVLACVTLRLLPHPPLRDRATYSRAFYSSDGALLRLTLAADGQYRVWTPLERIDPRLVDAVQLYEDRWFRWHPGFNPASLARAAWTTWRGDSRRGGSTLTMQLARRLYRIDSRSLPGKLKQIAASTWLEARYRKNEILEAYLNLAPYGGNVEGAEAASLIYFGKRADRLLLPQALALAVIPQNPNHRGADRRQAASESPDAAWPKALAAARQRLWLDWIARHRADATASNLAALALPLQLRSTRQLPFGAPHVVQMLMARLADVPETTLSIHAPTQALLERTIGRFVATRRGVGVRNAAALLVDTQTMAVRASVGSADWADAGIDGQVNAITAKRSPGSTLKPFIYALALDQGLLHPRSILKDAPTSFGTYNPENFDGRFEGPITARDALVRSRNVPAVSVSSRLSKPTLYEFLQSAGVSRLASEQHYGLALTLGGGELSMEELAAMYAMLANAGRLQPLAYTVASSAADNGSANARPLLSPEAAWITLDMLQANPRPDSGQRAFPRVAWKTGTSWGFRDAWTAGVFGRYVLVVWVGNFDGTGNPAFIGVQTAAPLFFQIVDSLRSQGLDPGELAQAAPPNLARVQVCAASGDLPNDECKDLATTWFIPGKSPIKVSTLHRAQWVDDASGRAVCAGTRNSHREVFEHWGSDMLQVFAQAGMPRRVPPSPARCGGRVASPPGERDDGPQIVSPLRGANYVLRLKQSATLTLRANAGRPGPLYWFADAAFLGSSAAGAEIAWQPPAAGRYMLSAVDIQGVADSREVSVEFAP